MMRQFPLPMAEDIANRHRWSRPIPPPTTPPRRNPNEPPFVPPFLDDDEVDDWDDWVDEDFTT
jgi:hypothetical protein